MNGLTTHILDLSRGLPASGVTVRLEQSVGTDWNALSEGVTNADGRARLISLYEPLELGIYRLTFEVAAYFEAQGAPAFYPVVQIIFKVEDERHSHVLLLLSPFGYSTYRGS